MLLGEGLAARRAEFGSDRVNKTAVSGFPQHAFDLAVTTARCESRGRVAKCIASIRVGSTGKQLLHNIDVTAIRRPHQRGHAVEVPGVDISSVLEKHLHQLDVASSGGKHKCRVAVAVARIYIGSLRKPSYRSLDVALIGSRDQIGGLL